jgi:purine-nucleoside phosphorylase
MPPAGSSSPSRLDQDLARALDAVRRRRPSARPKVALVLGSGMGAVVDGIEDSCNLAYPDLGMKASAVQGHAGTLVLGRLQGAEVAALQGRVHLYEGHAPGDVVLGVRALIALGARTVILTNAAGGIRADLAPGSLMLIEDHLNLTGQSCLVGPNDDAIGPRFPSLSDAYDARLRELAAKVAKSAGIALASGVYAGLLGPTYETPAEVRMLRTLGADAVGMSTVLETIAARHMGARVLGISCITNRAAGLDAHPPDHAEVQTAAARAIAPLHALVSGVVAALAKETAP